MSKIRLTMATDDRAPPRRPAPVVLDASAPAQTSGSPRGSSYYKRLRRCPREHALAKHALLAPVRDDEALTVGWLFHLGLEVYYRAQLAGADLVEREREVWAKLRPIATEPGYEDTYVTLERCLASYFDRWRDVDHWRVLAVEETVGVRWGRMEYSARFDLLVENLDDKGFWIVEHKTARALTSDLIEGYQLDLQTLGQVWLARSCLDLKALPPFRGVVVNITTKHVKPQHQRVLVCPSDAHLRAWQQSMGDWTSIAQRMEELGYPQAFGTCTGPDRGYRRCNYFELCHGWPEASWANWAEWDPPEQFVRVERARADEDDWTNEVST